MRLLISRPPGQASVARKELDREYHHQTEDVVERERQEAAPGALRTHPDPELEKSRAENQGRDVEKPTDASKDTGGEDGSQKRHQHEEAKQEGHGSGHDSQPERKLA